jgi:peptide/nickel transport system permease protein
MSEAVTPVRFRSCRQFARAPLSVLGLALVLAIITAALLAPWLAPFPRHAGTFTDFAHSNQPPGVTYWLGTDTIGRDVFSRILFGYRTSLLLGCVVLGIAVPLGTLAGLVAGYSRGALDGFVMRLTDVFLSVPSLLLAMTILGLFRPSQALAMVAVAAVWWPWYARLVYGLVRSLRHQGYVIAAEVIGTPRWRVLFGEILPNCAPTILTKASLDMGLVVLLGASLSYLGLGAPPPTPDLGTMVADGAAYLPDVWWISVGSGLAIFVLVLGFNLLGDGLRDLFDIDA